MSKLRELAIVNVELFRCGAPSVKRQLLRKENELWVFQDSDAETVWDVIENEEALVSRFTSNALLIKIDPAPTTKPRLNGMSYLESLLFAVNPDAAFARDVEALALVAQRRLLDTNGHNIVRFYGLFEVEFPDVDDRQLDARQIRASFLGELDFNRSLESLTFTVTTAELEARVLAAMRTHRSPMSVVLIADSVNVRHELIGDPILALDHAGLIVSDYTGQHLLYSLTDRAKKGIL